LSLLLARYITARSSSQELQALVVTINRARS
jgi:hypothetical protein